MNKDEMSKTLPYTQSIINKILTEIEKTELHLPNGAEFLAGYNHSKKEILLKIKAMKF